MHFRIEQASPFLGAMLELLTFSMACAHFVSELQWKPHLGNSSSKKELSRVAIRKCSLWFMPTGAVSQKFSQLIVQLAEHYSSPPFPPHVTLIGSIEAHEGEIISKTQELASLLHPFPIQLTTIAYTDSYYRALFVKVDPSTEVLEAYQQARKLFPDSQKTGYRPHLSLLYGDFSAETKKEIIKEIGENFTDEFEANTLYLYLTEGTASDWQRMKAFPLQK
jgi:2'-5' RNA ligase